MAQHSLSGLVCLSLFIPSHTCTNCSLKASLRQQIENLKVSGFTFGSFFWRSMETLLQTSFTNWCESSAEFLQSGCFYGLSHIWYHFSTAIGCNFSSCLCTTHSQLCESLSLRSMCVDLCRKVFFLVFAVNLVVPHCLASLASAHPLQVFTRLKLQNVKFAFGLPGAMTQPFVANADNVVCIDVLPPSVVPSCVLCDPANPASVQFITSDNSDNYVTANITNTLESAEAPVLKLNQVVKTQDHAMSELSRQSSDALEMFFRVSHEPCISQYKLGYSSVQNSNKCLEDVPRCW